MKTLLALKFIRSKIFGGADASIESTLSSLDAVNAAAFSKVRILLSFTRLKHCLSFFFLLQAAASLLSTKPTYVTIGESTLPYADELGL